MFDYNRLSTNKLEALKQRKAREIVKLQKSRWMSEEDHEQVAKLVIEIRHINAVLTSRQNTLRLEGF